MALIGALAENTRRNERVERGVISVTGSGTVSVPAPMRQITGFQLTLEDGGSGLATTAFQVSGSLNAAGTVLTIRTYSDTGAAGTTAVNVMYQIWGNLSAGAGF